MFDKIVDGARDNVGYRIESFVRYFTLDPRFIIFELVFQRIGRYRNDLVLPSGPPLVHNANSKQICSTCTCYLEFSKSYRLFYCVSVSYRR